MRWILGTAAAVLLAVVCFGSFLGLDQVTGFAQLVAFRTQFALAALVVAAALGRWWRAAVLPLVLVVAAAAIVVVPRLTDELVARPAGPVLRVLSANVLLDAADPAALAATITRTDADVVALPEASGRYARELAGRLDGYEVVTDPRLGSRQPSTPLVIRSSLQPAREPGPHDVSNDPVAARIRLGGHQLTVIGVHTTAPWPGREPTWSSDLAALATRCTRTTPTVLLGDFNATSDHSGFRGLTDAGCTDVGAAAGDGLVGTWPQRAPRALGAVLDHVLLAGAGLGATAYSVIDSPGSDHRAVSAGIDLGGQ